MKGTEQKYRHEIKYVISSAQMALLKGRISGMLKPDRHAGPDGVYTIRSLYFDDYENTCYFENENGTDPREKFRIRIYNHSVKRIQLECKRKEHGKTYKTSCALSPEQARFLMENKPIPNTPDLPPLLRKLLVSMKTQMLHPVVIVEYERIPFVYKSGNVRITFDMNIASSSRTSDFFEDDIIKRPIMPPGYHLMEVKYDEYLPDFIYRSLNLENLQQNTFSKYYLCRRFARK